MKQEVSAQDIKGSIASTGKIALYGILFDTGKSDIKPESSKAIKEIATFLQENPSIKIYIVGHTDNEGQLKTNIDLSNKRASAVVNELITTHKIDASRLEAGGVGPFAPVSTNDTEEGKKLNRRVEIVKK
jgi:outer membrane protein OmpA-like peptidoglycan-associated protein